MIELANILLIELIYKVNLKMLLTLNLQLNLMLMDLIDDDQ